MAYKDGLDDRYPTDHEFTEDELLELTPEIVVKWFRLLAYGTDNPGPLDHPTCCRSTYLLQAKKAVSRFMPNQQPWVVQGGFGNPTKSALVNAVIREVKLAEVRRLGRPSSAKRDLTRSEYRMILRMLETGMPLDHLGKYQSMLKLQFHIIGRADDISNLETDDIRAHGRFPFCGQLKVSWSKNVMDERSCPDQILIGSFDSDFCVLIGLAIWLECSLRRRQMTKFLYEETDDIGAPDRLNSRYRRMLTVLFSKPEFQALLARTKGGVGTHSIRKFSATWASRNGALQGEIEIRGRWKGSKGGRVVHQYINVEQLPTDGKVAGILSVGGPVRYRIKPESHVTEEFLRETVVPAIHAHFSHDESNQIVQLLGPALLYAAHVPELQKLFDEEVLTRIIHGYEAIRNDHPADYNPVEKVRLHIYRVENELCIEDLDVGDLPDLEPAPNNFHSVPGRRNFDQQREDIRTTIVQIHRLQVETNMMKQQLEGNLNNLRNYVSNRFSIVDRNMTRYYISPVRPITRRRGPPPALPNVGTAPIPENEPEKPLTTTDFLDPRACLGKPRTLLELWHEWMHGLGSNKPAKDFTAYERGRCRFLYSRRKAFWDVMIFLINQGNTDLTAIDLIKQCYGQNLSVTETLKHLVKAKTFGYHRNLGIRGLLAIRNRGSRHNTN
jgi:hypothetical protein